MNAARPKGRARSAHRRVQFGAKVAPDTDAKIRAEVQESGRSAGQVIDRWAEVVRPMAHNETEEKTT
jgi:hypothetical protein